jgi:hypothetical protein
MSRFQAWNAYLPFSMAFALLFFGRSANSVFSVVFLGMIPLHLLLNRRERQRTASNAHGSGFLPQGKVLQLLIGCCAGGMLLQLLSSLRRDQTASDKIGNFFSDFVAPWMFGSFASQIPAVTFGSMVAGTTFVICVTPVKPRTTPPAKASLSLLFCLSLFTIWVSSSVPNSLESAAGFAAETALKSFIKAPVDLALSVVWGAGLARAISEINRERAAYPSLPRSEVAFPPTRRWMILPAAGWLTLLTVLLAIAMRA